MTHSILQGSCRIVSIAVLVLFGSLAAVGQAQNPQPAKAGEDPFEQVDLEFRAMYSSGRTATLQAFGPVIVAEMDQLILIRDGKRIEAKAIPQLYHRLKAVSHIPLAIYVSLAPFGEKPLDEQRKAQLRTFQQKIASVLASLDKSGFDEAQIARSRTLLDRCAAFLEEVQKNGTYELASLLALTKVAGPIVLANASDAAKAQIDGYHVQVASWRREIPAAEWSKLRVLVLGPQMPRKHNVAVQYFAKLMDLPGESRRLVYAEELTGLHSGLNLLATHQLDSELSEAFFGDRERMEIDLVGNAAAVYLDGFDLSK